MFSLNTAIQGVGEGNYGRMGPDDQRRYTDANAETMISEPPPAASPTRCRARCRRSCRRRASATDDRNIDRCWGCRSMFMQAWGNYGTAWPVVHQQLGVRRTSGATRSRSCRRCRRPAARRGVRHPARPGLDRRAARRARGKPYTTRVNAGDTPARSLTLGVVLPDGVEPRSVRLDGRESAPLRAARDEPRGRGDGAGAIGRRARAAVTAR